MPVIACDADRAQFPATSARPLASRLQIQNTRAAHRASPRQASSNRERWPMLQPERRPTLERVLRHPQQWHARVECGFRSDGKEQESLQQRHAREKRQAATTDKRNARKKYAAPMRDPTASNHFRFEPGLLFADFAAPPYRYPSRSKTAPTINGNATVASSSTSANRPPSSSGTNFPHETASV
jgi:hypothetical protein